MKQTCKNLFLWNSIGVLPKLLHFHWSLHGVGGKEDKFILEISEQREDTWNNFWDMEEVLIKIKN